MAVASEIKETKTEPSMESFPCSPLTSKPGSDAGSETSPVVTAVVSDLSDPNDQSDLNDESDSSLPPIRKGEAELSASSSQRNDVDILLSQAYLKSEEYRLMFRLPPDEVLVQDFNCAFQESILFQGHMYLFVRHICFYSNIFGFETKKIIPFHEVSCVRKAKTAAIFPNAIEIVSAGKKHFFASFLSRDEAYRLIVDGWSHSINGANVLIDHQDIKSEIRSQDDGSVMVAEIKNFQQPTGDLSTVDRIKEANPSGEIKLLSNGDDDLSISTRLMEPQENEEDTEAVTAECSSFREPLRWQVEEAGAPKVPEYFTKVAESKFPIHVEEFFDIFFSDYARSFTETFHRRCGDKEFRCTTWYEHEQFGHAREVSFLHPIKIYFGAKFGNCQEIQKFRVYRNSHLVIETSQEINDVPYGDYFRVEGLWVVEREGTENCCILRVHVNVAFSKKTMWKGKIEQSTVEECREAYSIWINNAHEYLKQQDLEKPNEMVAARNSNPVRLEGNEDDKSPSLHDTRNLVQIPSQDVSSHQENPVQGDLSYVYIATSFLRESLTGFCLYVRSRIHVPLALVVASILMLLLMQVSIIALLVRTPQVHVVSQVDYLNGISSSKGDRAEAVAWLEKQVQHLKDDMAMVEGRLEKMRHDHTLLKLHLKALELKH